MYILCLNKVFVCLFEVADRYTQLMARGDLVLPPDSLDYHSMLGCEVRIYSVYCALSKQLNKL